MCASAKVSFLFVEGRKSQLCYWKIGTGLCHRCLRLRSTVIASLTDLNVSCIFPSWKPPLLQETFPRRHFLISWACLADPSHEPCLNCSDRGPQKLPISPTAFSCHPCRSVAGLLMVGKRNRCLRRIVKRAPRLQKGINSGPIVLLSPSKTQDYQIPATSLRQLTVALLTPAVLTLHEDSPYGEHPQI